MEKHVVIAGAGFAGINAAKALGRAGRTQVTVVDQRNHHLFQPLLYQVAMAGLDPSDIASPIRSLLRPYPNCRTLLERVDAIDLSAREIVTDVARIPYDYLILACGARHSYFGHDQWEEFAPGLKTVEQATEIRRRVLIAFEEAERTDDPVRQDRWMTFVIVGGGPTGVELAGAIAEMARYALAKDFSRIDATKARVVLIEGGERILSQFEAHQSKYAERALEKLGVEVITGRQATAIDSGGVWLGDERITAKTVLWAAGVQASKIGRQLGVETDRAGRVMVGTDLSLPDHPEVFVAGDMAHVQDEQGRPLPGLAPVAMQEGHYLGRIIAEEVRRGTPPSHEGRPPFRFRDKGQMATIGRNQAVLQSGRIKMQGGVAWLAWLLVHIYYLNSFRRRLFVFLNWTFSYLAFSKGARLIVHKEWRLSRQDTMSPASEESATEADRPMTAFSGDRT